jgi:uncharacterized protein (DUF58 family)
MAQEIIVWGIVGVLSLVVVGAFALFIVRAQVKGQIETTRLLAGRETKAEISIRHRTENEAAVRGELLPPPARGDRPARRELIRGDSPLASRVQSAGEVVRDSLTSPK